MLPEVWPVPRGPVIPHLLQNQGFCHSAMRPSVNSYNLTSFVFFIEPYFRLLYIGGYMFCKVGVTRKRWSFLAILVNWLSGGLNVKVKRAPF